MTIEAKLEKILGKNKVKVNFNLSPYLTLRTDTTVQYFFTAESDTDIIKAINCAIELKLAYYVIGGGSNLAIVKKKLSGLVIRNKYISKKIVYRGKFVFVTVSSGYPVTKLAKELAESGIAGLEYHLGLPGTVGGALYMNSKWTKPLNYFGDNLISARLIDDRGKEKTVNRKYFDFAYDQSSLQRTHEVVLEATFKLIKDKPDKTTEHAAFVNKYRRETQPFGVFTSGCFFKNINGQSAGKLIDQAGLKNKRVGQFHVSSKHANFIIHDGSGNPEDLKRLLKLIKTSVKKKFGVDLQEEVIVI